MMKKVRSFLVNPFEDFRDNTLLTLGLTAYLLGSLQVYFFSYVPDGVFQAHLSTDVAWYAGFVNNAINIVFPTLVLWIFGRVVYSKTRLFDVFNVVMIAQIVNYIIATLLLNPFAKSKLLKLADAVKEGDMLLQTVSKLDIVIPSIGGIIAVGLLVYFFYLIIVGMKLAMNSKKTIHAVIIVGLMFVLDTVLHLVHLYV